MARLSAPRTEAPTRLAVIADPHVSTRETGTSKLFEHTVDHLEYAVADISERSVDAVVCLGDLTKDGEPWNYAAFDEVLAGLEPPFFAIPGNHDVPKAGDEHASLPLGEFEGRYTPGTLPYTAQVGGLDLVALNSAGDQNWLHESHAGEVPPAQIDWVDRTLGGLDNPVVLVHHNLPAMAAQVRAHRDAVAPDMGIPPEMRNPDPLVDVLAAHDIPLVLTGHLHLPSAAEMGEVLEVMAPTTCSYPHAYLLLESGPEGTTIRLVPIVDHDGMLRGYHERRTDTLTARELTAMASVRLANFPLVDR
ncbi:MAG: metallophosphoesterase [Halobacteriales archaeon]